ncbi:hypothetical protein [Cylindrospermopsis raciborskii]|uniref:hypothetical protein n=1 Tax=Cylindrospermopsis raciborskii TaxID=77022 RepID=UPI002B48AEBF|nr:hypothetical protein [Cylindrospermopsis raciborskii]
MRSTRTREIAFSRFYTFLLSDRMFCKFNWNAVARLRSTPFGRSRSNFYGRYPGD